MPADAGDARSFLYLKREEAIETEILQGMMICFTGIKMLLDVIGFVSDVPCSLGYMGMTDKHAEQKDLSIQESSERSFCHTNSFFDDSYTHDVRKRCGQRKRRANEFTLFNDWVRYFDPFMISSSLLVILNESSSLQRQGCWTSN